MSRSQAWIDATLAYRSQDQWPPISPRGENGKRLPRDSQGLLARSWAGKEEKGPRNSHTAELATSGRPWEVFWRGPFRRQKAPCPLAVPGSPVRTHPPGAVSSRVPAGGSARPTELGSRRQLPRPLHPTAPRDPGPPTPHPRQCSVPRRQHADLIRDAVERKLYEAPGFKTEGPRRPDAVRTLQTPWSESAHHAN